MPNLSPEIQRANIAALADYLRTLPADYSHFNMGRYSYDDIGPADVSLAMECGTAACAVGHGPLADGIVQPGTICSSMVDSWNYYCLQAFGVDADGEVYKWLFDGDWVHTDNTIEGAVLRIEHYLKSGTYPQWFLDENGAVGLDYHGEDFGESYEEFLNEQRKENS